MSDFFTDGEWRDARRGDPGAGNLPPPDTGDGTVWKREVFCRPTAPRPDENPRRRVLKAGERYLPPDLACPNCDPRCQQDAICNSQTVTLQKEWTVELSGQVAESLGIAVSWAEAVGKELQCQPPTFKVPCGKVGKQKTYLRADVTVTERELRCYGYWAGIRDGEKYVRTWDGSQWTVWEPTGAAAGDPYLHCEVVLEDCPTQGR